MRKNRQCICCSAEYSYCPDCGGHDRFKESWYSTFCSEDCKDLWLTATKFNMGMLEKQDAKDIISALNLKDKSEYVECVQRDLNNIFAADEEPKPKRGKRAEAHILDEVLNVESHEVVNKTEE